MKLKLPIDHPFARRVYGATKADPSGRLLLTLHTVTPESHTVHRTLEITTWSTHRDKTMTMELADPLEQEDWTLQKLLGTS